jgi:hypothetical protein
MDMFIWVVFALLLVVHVRNYLQNKQTEEQLLDTIEIIREELNALMFVTLEFVKQDQHEVWLVYEYQTRTFLCQGESESQCELELTRLFPQRKILIVAEETC